MKWNVTRKSTGELLGVVVKAHKNVGTLRHPSWRSWYVLDGNDRINADRRSVIAAHLAGGPDYKMELV